MSSFVKPIDYSHSPVINQAAYGFLNAVKYDIVESRSFFEKLIDFSTPRDEWIEKYTEKFNSEILSLIESGFDSLTLEASDATAKIFTYAINHNGKVIKFDSLNECLTRDALARALIDVAGGDGVFKELTPNSGGLGGHIFINGEAHGVTGLSLTPLDEHGKYYADHENGFIFVSNNKKDDEGSLDALIHLVHHGLKPVIVNITKDCYGDLYLTPANKHTIEYAGCVFENSYSIDNKSHNIKCDANVLESAIQFMEFAVDVPGVIKYITVDNFTPENIGIFKRLVCDKDAIIEGVPGTSAIQVRLFSSFGKMTSILFTDFPKQAINKRDLDDILLILHNIDRYRKMSEYIYTNSQTIHEAQIAYLITGEQLFDSQPNGKTDTEQSILLAKAIMTNDVIYYDKNQNVLHFSGSSFKLSFREGSCGEGRGEHVFESDVSPGTIDKQKLINSLFSSVLHQHALDFISDKQRRL